MKTHAEEIAAAQRRGVRILALQRGQPIPFRDTAITDARPGNGDDEIIAAMVRGGSPIPGAGIFPPATLLAQTQAGLVREAANERQEILAIGPTVIPASFGEYLFG